MPVPNPSALSSTFQVGTYTSLTDTFTSVFDLNDGVVATIMWNTLRMPQPEKAFVRSFNLRAPGERVTRFQYKNRHIQVSVSLRGATVQTILNTVHSLIAAIENPPYRIRFSQPNATQYTYASVVAVTHNIPADPQTLLAKALTDVQIDFECLPGLLGDRVTLSNLAVNPGFEAPSGPSVTVFNDGFANLNAYTTIAGSAPSVAANVMTIPAGTTVQFGSPAWGAINQWKVRFQYVSGATFNFDPHVTDANNFLRTQIFTNQIGLFHTVGGVSHQLAIANPTLTTNTFYWLVFTQFPVQVGTTPYVEAMLFNDSAGTIGSAVTSGTVGPVLTFDGVTALIGRPRISAATSTLLIGGAFGGVHVMQLFGPGGWIFNPTTGTGSVVCSGAWEQTTANTYPNGPVTSYGAARIDFGPAGINNTYWQTFAGGAPAGSSAMPIAAAGNVVAASIAVKSSNLSANATITLQVQEWDINGAFLRNDPIQTVTGNQAAWTVLSGTATTGASCAYVGIAIIAQDPNAGGSANGTVWFDNAQVYNQTTTGQTTMAWHDLRGPQSPYQLMVSGLLGDMPSPAFVAAGTYLSSWGANNTLLLLLGRRQYSSANAQLVTSDLSAQVSPVLDSTSYGGYYMGGTSGYADNAVIGHPGDLQGVYHVWSRFYSAQAAGKLPSVTVQVNAFDQNVATLFTPVSSNILWTYRGPSFAPIKATTTWTPTDAGQVNIPLAARGSLTNPQQNYVTMGAYWTDASPPTNNRLNWQALIPVDGGILIVVANNPSASGTTVSTSWFWHYVDGLSAPSATNSGATSYSVETTATPNPGAASGGPGTLSSPNVNINPGGDPYIVLDPTLAVNGVAVNQFAGFIADANGSVLSMHTEFVYTPLYLYPR